MNTFKNNSPRLTGYDYANNGSYFVTICTFNRLLIFGEIKNGQMALSKIGKSMDDALKQTAIIREYITIGEYIIMPNHIHAIVYLHQGNDGPEWLPLAGIHGQLNPDEEYKNQFGPQSKNLASVIRGIKRRLLLMHKNQE